MKATFVCVFAWTAAAALGVAAPAARADVVNGGFETGTFAGWTQTGDTSFSGVDPFAARSGGFGAFFGPTAVGGISQSFATIANSTYQVSFALSLTDNGIPNSFSWTWNGATQGAALTNATAFGYTTFTAPVLATGASSTLAFNFRNPQSFWLLDNVSAVATPVPEPEIALLFGGGLVLMLRKLQARGRRGRA